MQPMDQRLQLSCTCSALLMMNVWACLVGDAFIVRSYADLGVIDWNLTFEADAVEWFRRTGKRLREENQGIPVPGLIYVHIPVCCQFCYLFYISLSSFYMLFFPIRFQNTWTLGIITTVPVEDWSQLVALCLTLVYLLLPERLVAFTQFIVAMTTKMIIMETWAE